jgi:[amino group carrier protein]-lysine/ornithine hydrolase
MKDLGYRRVRRDGAGNAIGVIGGGGPGLLLCGHMDTVPGRLRVREEDGFLYGRGASDAKAALCAMVLAGARAASSGIKVTVAGATEEEGDGRGVRSLASADGRWRWAVFGEPAGAGRVTIGYRGRMGVTVTVRTEGGHAGSPWAWHSAFDEFSSFMRRVRAAERAGSVEGDRYRSLSITPTLIRAGSYPNVIPSRLTAALDVRVPLGTSCSDVSELLRQASRAKGGKISLEFDEATEPYEAPPSSIVARAFQRGIISASHSKPVLVRKTGTGDMNTFAPTTGAECITYGPGDSRTSHSERERVGLSDYLASIDVIARAVGELEALGEARS